MTTATQPKNHKTKTVVAPPGTSLDERAMLVHLSIGFWSGKKIDQNKSSEITTKAKAQDDAGAWFTQVVPAAAINQVLKVRTQARAVHLKYTLPWRDDGSRVLPAAMFFEYSSAMRKAEEGFRKAVAAFIAEYPGHVRTGAERLGELFKAEMFPSPEALSGKFPWAIHYSPLPTGGDFRVDLGSETTDALRKQIQRQAEQTMSAAMDDLWDRLHETVSRIADKLNDPEGVFRDSLIENVTELCDLLPKLNVTGSRELDDARKEVLGRLANKKPAELRANKAARADTTKAANDILKKMESFRPRK